MKASTIILTHDIINYVLNSVIYFQKYNSSNKAKTANRQKRKWKVKNFIAVRSDEMKSHRK